MDEEILDTETDELLQSWLDDVLPHMADECAEAIEEDAVDVLLAARAEGLSPEDAVKRLPKKRKMKSFFGQRYLLVSDKNLLEKVHEQLHNRDESKNRLQISIIVIVIVAALFYVAAVIVYPGMYVGLPTVAYMVMLISLSASARMIRVKLIETVGPIGSALFSFEAYSMLLSSLFALYMSMNILMSGGRVFERMTVIVLLVLFFAGMPSYVATIRRFQNNREIVGRILGLQGYGEDD